MANSNWDGSNVPDQKEKIIVITGASSGLGKEAAKVLASKNSKVIMANRNTDKAEKVADEIRKEFPNAKIENRALDLNSLKSIHAFADAFKADHGRLDVLINNAGVMMCPYSKTEDGFEIQMGTNHFGHFALTGLLMPLLLNTENARVIATSSVAHQQGNIDFTDINWEKRKYNTNKAYGDSKLANLYFIYELARKYKDHKKAPLFIASHPGATNTDLGRHLGMMRYLIPVLGQSVEMGTLPTLRAATDPTAKSGDYYGPKNFFEWRGYPVKVKSNTLSRNQENAQRLWDLSEQLTGIKF